MLWIALHLPLLSLEAFSATLAPAGSAASEDATAREGATAGPGESMGSGESARSGERARSGHGGEPPAEPLAAPPVALMDAHRIVAADAAARALGVKTGLKRATALALAPQLVLGRADAARDTQALEPVSHAALAFTPMVLIQPSDERDQASHTVLLEVESSLRYFGGRTPLLQRLRAALAPLNHAVHCVLAPTAQGAALLARVHRRLHCADLATMQQRLDAAPVWLLGPGSEHWDALQGMGLRTLGDLRSLPRSGLARRFGERLLGELDRALGLEPDPRIPIVLPPVFESRLELFARADTTEQVLHGASVLLARLVPWLAAQHAFVRRFTLTMQHEARRLAGIEAPRSTALEIALAEPSRDSAHLQVLLRERLAHLQLPAPTLDLVLRADDIARRAPPNQELFPTSRSEREGLTQLIERLQARLGAGQVQRLHPVEDHRPECGSRVGAGIGLGDQAAHASLGLRGQAARANPASPPTRASRRRTTPRPVWLLQQPEPLPERQSRPLLDGRPLQLLSGPERIEAGWWDSARAERDYFIAQAADGALVWIYRARLPLSAAADAQGWFMQGRFG